VSSARPLARRVPEVELAACRVDVIAKLALEALELAAPEVDLMIERQGSG